MTKAFAPSFNCQVFCFFAVYSNALQESANSILYNGLIEELVDVLQITDKQLVVRKYFLFSAKSIISLNAHVTLGLYLCLFCPA